MDYPDPDATPSRRSRRHRVVAADFPDLRIVGAHPAWPWQEVALAVARHKTDFDRLGIKAEVRPKIMLTNARVLLDV